MKSPGYTYFIQAGEDGPIKIGATTKPPKERLAALQTGCPEPLRLLAVVAGVHHEPRMHERFAEWRIQGEWFAAEAPRLGQLIRAIRKNINADVHRATFQMLRKLHRATNCGSDINGLHWIECYALCQAYGWDSWDDWRGVVDAVSERYI